MLLSIYRFTHALVDLFGKAKEAAEPEVERPLKSPDWDTDDLTEAARQLLGRGRTIAAAGLIGVGGYEFRQVILAYQLGWVPPGRIEFLTFRERIDGWWGDKGIPMFGAGDSWLDGMKILLLATVVPDCMDNPQAQQQVVRAIIAELMVLDKLPKAGS